MYFWVKYLQGWTRPKEELLDLLYWPGGSTVIGGGFILLVASGF